MPADRGEPEAEAHLDREASRVAEACGTEARGVVRAIRAQMKLRAARENPGDVGDAMIAAWREYAALGDELLRFVWGPRKFFGEGHWAVPALWPVDKERRDRAAAARVGCA